MDLISQSLIDITVNGYVNCLPDFPLFASVGKVKGVFVPPARIPRERALLQPYVQPNGPFYIKNLVFDIDRHYDESVWKRAGLPPPNLEVVGSNGRAHIFYILDKGIWLKRPGDKRAGHAAPERLLRAVRKAMQRRLRADRHYNGQTAKNPLSDAWTTTSPRQFSYSLSELAGYLDLNELPGSADLIDNPEGRNSTLFDSVRIWSYRYKAKIMKGKIDCSGLPDFQEAIMEELERLNDQIDHPDGPLGFNELRGIGKSISSWTWRNYTGSGKAVNRGVMQLDQSMSLRERQSASGHRTCGMRRADTMTKIVDAIRELESQNLPVNKSSVAREANLTRNTVSVYWDQIHPSTSHTDTVTLTPSLSPPLGDTLMHTVLGTPGCDTFDVSLEYFNGNRVKAIQEAVRWAERGTLMPGLPRMLEKPLQRVVDTAAILRHTYGEPVTIGSA